MELTAVSQGGGGGAALEDRTPGACSAVSSHEGEEAGLSFLQSNLQPSCCSARPSSHASPCHPANA